MVMADIEWRITRTREEIAGHRRGVARLKQDLADRERTLVWWQSHLMDLEHEKAEAARAADPAPGGGQ